MFPQNPTCRPSMSPFHTPYKTHPSLIMHHFLVYSCAPSPPSLSLHTFSLSILSLSRELSLIFSLSLSQWQLGLDRPAVRASFSGGSVRPIVYLLPIFARSKGRLDSRRFIRCLVLVMFRNYCCMSQFMSVAKQQSPSLMKLRLGLEILFMAAWRIFSLCSNRLFSLYLFFLHTKCITNLKKVHLICCIIKTKNGSLSLYLLISFSLTSHFPSIVFFEFNITNGKLQEKIKRKNK